MKYYTDEQQLEIGRAVLKGLEGGCSWKLMERTYARCRQTLWRYACAAAKAGKGVANPNLQHLGGLSDRRNAA